MRNIILGTILTILFTSCSSDSDLKNWGLNGKVKSAFEQIHEVEKKFGEWEPGDLIYSMHSKINFDEKGLYTNIEYYGYDMELSMKIIPMRENGVVIEETNYDGDGKLQGRTIINQISNSQSESETFDIDKNKTYQSKITRKNGRVIKIVQTMIDNEKEGETYTFLFEYDKDGNEISQTRTTTNHEADESFVKYEYLEFDKKKNWTKRLVYQNSDKPEYLSVRKIEYYE